MPPTLAVVVVNYRTPALAVDCLRSLAPEVAANPGTRVVVADGGSGDGSAEHLARAVADHGWGGWAEVLPLEENRGFSAGNNACIQALWRRGAAPDFFWLLNPDTVVRPGAIRALLARAAATPRAGIVGSRLEHPDGTLQHSAFRFHGIASELDGALRTGLVSALLSRWALVLPHPPVATRADWVSGASLLVRREVLEAIGLMDEGFFLYYEEVDLCRRAARAGWECWREPASRVVHLVGQSTGADPTGQARLPPAYALASRRRYLVKHHGLAYTALADLAWLVGHLGWRLQRSLRGRPAPVPPGLVRHFLRHSVWAGAGRDVARAGRG
jgi:GT2 family glycosyltransferase